MRIALLYGRFASGGPNSFDIRKLYRGKGLTGSESSYFNMARGLAERGHQVQVFADVVDEIKASPELAGADAWKLESSARMFPDVDAVLAWNEPDLLRLVPNTALRVVFQQLNDFDYCFKGYDEFVDLYAFPSLPHLQFMSGHYGIPLTKCVVVPNSTNLEFFEPNGAPRRTHSVAYCSSPDRGLHWLLEWWPHVRARVPDAQLRIYYKVEPWLQSVRDLWYDQGLRQWYSIGFRARYVEEALRRIGRAGENGVTLVGPISNVDMAKELLQTELLVYPCDTVRWTEGFSVAIMDACAAGAVPIISDVDALGGIYSGAAHVVPGRPQSRDQRWIEAIVHGLVDPGWRIEARLRAFGLAQLHDRSFIAAQTEALLLERARKQEAA